MSSIQETRTVIQAIQAERETLEKERESISFELAQMKERLTSSRAYRDKYTGAQDLLTKLQNRLNLLKTGGSTSTPS